MNRALTVQEIRERHVRRRRLWFLTILALAVMTVAVLSSAASTNSPSPPECDIVLSRDGTYSIGFDQRQRIWPPRCAPNPIWEGEAN